MSKKRKYIVTSVVGGFTLRTRQCDYLGGVFEAQLDEKSGTAKPRLYMPKMGLVEKLEAVHG
jgi:hypothetical protein